MVPLERWLTADELAAQRLKNRAARPRSGTFSILQPLAMMKSNQHLLSYVNTGERPLYLHSLTADFPVTQLF